MINPSMSMINLFTTVPNMFYRCTTSNVHYESCITTEYIIVYCPTVCFTVKSLLILLIRAAFLFCYIVYNNKILQ